MISNQILQSTLDGLKVISRMDYCITDVEGKEVASTARIHLNEAAIVNFAHSPADTQEVQGAQYFKVYDDKQLEYVLIVIGTGEISHVAGKMAAFQMQNLVVAYKERFDKDNFIKNLLLDNLLLVDIYGRAKKLHIAIGAPRVVLVLEATKGIDSDLLEVVRERCSNYIGGGHNDFVTAVDEKNVIIVAELEENSTTSNVEAAASALLEHLHKLGLHGLRIACGTIVQEIKEVSRSYKEAKMALDVGRIFFENRNVVAYSELGIGRLIYQLPLPLCKMFIEEIFDDISPDDFDEETLTTINKFFENSLNVSETSRQLFIHRNTLVYRLDKLQRSTGLDLRVFEDAITFRIALMVVKYMKYMETSEY